MQSLQRLSVALLLVAFGGGWLVCHAEEPSAAPADSAVALKDVFKDHFQIGVAVNRAITTGRAFRRSPEEVQKDVALVKQQFNQIVPENDMKWQLIHPRPGAAGFEFGPADAFVEFGLSNRLSLAGHTLVWHSQTPDWVFQAGAAANGPRASREELLERMREHIHAVVGRYKGKIKVWDVVNEALADGGPDILRKSPWSEIIGPDYVAKAFEFAHEADPDAILRYNDYGLENPEKRRKLMALVKSLKEQKAPVMAIGSQAHCNVSITFDAMDQALTDLKTLDLPIYITELDVASSMGGQRGGSAARGGAAAADKRLAEAYAGLFRAFVKHHAAIEAVTFWGVNDAVSWRAQGRPLLFDGNDQPKPAFDAVIQTAAGK
jgi:endo-1,4-beta-xylanase